MKAWDAKPLAYVPQLRDTVAGLPGGHGTSTDRTQRTIALLAFDALGYSNCLDTYFWKRMAMVLQGQICIEMLFRVQRDQKYLSDTYVPLENGYVWKTIRAFYLHDRTEMIGTGAPERFIASPREL